MQLLIINDHKTVPLASVRRQKQGVILVYETDFLKNGNINEEEGLSMESKRAAKDFPVVCVGGSAGGLDARS